MKKIFLSIALSGLLISNVNASGVPTFDYGQIAESVMQHNETLEQWYAQMQEMEKHYKAISGMNTWQDVINSDYFWDFFPKEAEDVAVGNASTDEVLDRINEALKDDESFEKFKQKELNRVATRNEQAKKNYESASKRMDDIKETMEEAGKNEELKDSVDFSNLMLGKIAMIVNESTRLTSENQLVQAEELERNKIEDDRAKEAMDMSNGAYVYPLK